MNDLIKIKNDFVSAASSIEDRLLALSDGFYKNPETGLEEHKTSAAMQGLLKGFGFAVESGIAGMSTAFRASLGAGAPVIALLAEMDALPGIGHGCGHNVAGTASVGAAAALSIVLPEMQTGKKDASRPGQGTLLVLGTPAEELGRGKIEMIKAGVFEKVDAAMMVHGSSKRTVVKHFLGLMRLRFVFYGKASHASAYPQEGINALDAVIQTFNSINALRQQLKTDVRVHGIITDGGKAPNIIPERSEAEFYVRSKDIDELESVRRRVINCAEGAAKATGCALEVISVGEVNYPMKLNDAFADVYRGALSYIGLLEHPEPAIEAAGSSDIGNVSQVIPTIHPHVPLRPGINIHTREFADATVSPDGHRALMEGVKTLGLTSIDLLFNPATLRKIKEAFSARK